MPLLNTPKTVYLNLDYNVIGSGNIRKRNPENYEFDTTFGRFHIFFTCKSLTFDFLSGVRRVSPSRSTVHINLNSLENRGFNTNVGYLWFSIQSFFPLLYFDAMANWELTWTEMLSGFLLPENCRLETTTSYFGLFLHITPFFTCYLD